MVLRLLHVQTFCAWLFAKLLQNNSFLLFIKGGGDWGKGGTNCLSSWYHKHVAYCSHFYQSNILEDSADSTHHYTWPKIVWRSNKNMSIFRTDPALMLWASVDLTSSPSHFTPPIIPHTYCPAMCILPGLLDCSLPPSAKCQKCMAFSKVWIKYHHIGTMLVTPSPECLHSVTRVVHS